MAWRYMARMARNRDRSRGAHRGREGLRGGCQQLLRIDGQMLDWGTLLGPIEILYVRRWADLPLLVTWEEEVLIHRGGWRLCVAHMVTLTRTSQYVVLIR